MKGVKRYRLPVIKYMSHGEIIQKMFLVFKKLYAEHLLGVRPWAKGGEKDFQVMIRSSKCFSGIFIRHHVFFSRKQQVKERR